MEGCHVRIDAAPPPPITKSSRPTIASGIASNSTVFSFIGRNVAFISCKQQNIFLYCNLFTVLPDQKHIFVVIVMN